MFSPGYTRVDYTPATDDTGAFWSDGGSATVDVGVWGHQEPRIDVSVAVWPYFYFFLYLLI